MINIIYCCFRPSRNQNSLHYLHNNASNNSNAYSHIILSDKKEVKKTRSEGPPAVSKSTLKTVLKFSAILRRLCATNYAPKHLTRFSKLICQHRLSASSVVSYKTTPPYFLLLFSEIIREVAEEVVEFCYTPNFFHNSLTVLGFVI